MLGGAGRRRRDRVSRSKATTTTTSFQDDPVMRVLTERMKSFDPDGLKALQRGSPQIRAVPPRSAQGTLESRLIRPLPPAKVPSTSFTFSLPTTTTAAIPLTSPIFAWASRSMPATSLTRTPSPLCAFNTPSRAEFPSPPLLQPSDMSGCCSGRDAGATKPARKVLRTVRRAQRRLSGRAARHRSSGSAPWTCLCGKPLFLKHSLSPRHAMPV